jgi:hypothetical protein
MPSRSWPTHCRRKAPDAEIKKLMQELRKAMQDYMKELAQRQNAPMQPNQNAENMLRQQDLEKMMNQIEKPRPLRQPRRRPADAVGIAADDEQPAGRAGRSKGSSRAGEQPDAPADGQARPDPAATSRS